MSCEPSVEPLSATTISAARACLAMHSAISRRQPSSVSASFRQGSTKETSGSLGATGGEDAAPAGEPKARAPARALGRPPAPEREQREHRHRAAERAAQDQELRAALLPGQG